MSASRVCYVEIPGEPGKIGIVNKGEKGYYHSPGMTREAADKKNEIMGVSFAEREAMLVGSMCGWGVPGAQPENCKYAKSLVEEHDTFSKAPA